jgi:hypothetical protein
MDRLLSLLAVLDANVLNDKAGGRIDRICKGWSYRIYSATIAAKGCDMPFDEQCANVDADALRVR